jgi:hypothetical protein
LEFRELRIGMRRIGNARLAVAVALVLVAPALVTSGVAMANRGIGREEYQHLASVFGGQGGDLEQADASRRHMVVQMASYVDHLHLPSGSILADTFSPCIPELVLAVQRPKVFVITNDRDFKASVADPIARHVQFLLVPSGGNTTSLDALVRAFPDLHSGGYADLAHQFSSSNPLSCADLGLWRLH